MNSCQTLSKPCLVNLISKDTHIVFLYSSQDVESANDITPFIKVDKQPVDTGLHIFLTLCNDGQNNINYLWQNLELFTRKTQFQSSLVDVKMEI